MRTLKLVLTDHWFEEIKSGRKTHEYRKATPFWISRIYNTTIKCAENHLPKRSYILSIEDDFYVEFQKAYRKNAEKMLFKVKAMSIHYGRDTDLHTDDFVFDIELGERIR